MSYHDTTAQVVQKEEDIDDCFESHEHVVWSKKWGIKTDYEQIEVIMRGEYNPVTNIYFFREFSFQHSHWKWNEFKNHCDLSINHMESLSHALHTLGMDSDKVTEDFHEEIGIADMQIQIWKEIKQYLLKWQP